MNMSKSAVVLVFNQKGQLALQLRSKNDTKYPLHWDFSAAGGIEDGENPDKAALREMKEEIGIDGTLNFLGEVLYLDIKATEQDHLYLFNTQHEGPFKLDSVEVEKVEFFDFDQIEFMLKTGEKFHPQFPYLWEKGLIK